MFQSCQFPFNLHPRLMFNDHTKPQMGQGLTTGNTTQDIWDNLSEILNISTELSSPGLRLSPISSNPNTYPHTPINLLPNHYPAVTGSITHMNLNIDHSTHFKCQSYMSRNSQLELSYKSHHPSSEIIN